MENNYIHQLTYFDNSNFAEIIHRQIEKDYPNASIVKERDGNTAVYITELHKKFCDYYVGRNCKCVYDKSVAQWAIDKARKIAMRFHNSKQRGLL